MTQEELKEAAESYVDRNIHPQILNDYGIDVHVNTFIAGAKFRQKEIDELVELVKEYAKIIWYVYDRIEYKKKEKITYHNRCKFAKQTETVEESKSRSNGFLSALLCIKDKMNNEDLRKKYDTIEELLKKYSDEKKDRFFIITYMYKPKHGDFVYGNLPRICEKDSFIFCREFCKSIENDVRNKTGREVSVLITNIIELSKDDYYQFIKE